MRRRPEAARGRGVGGTADFTGWWAGGVGLRVATPEPHRFLNALLAARIPFARARLDPQGVRLTTTVGGFRRLRHAVRGLGVRVHVVERRGFPFLAARWRRRPALLATCLLAAVTLYALSGSVWFIQVQGADRVAPAEVLAAAARLGLAPGVRRAALRAAALGRGLEELLPDVSWAGVTFYGTLAVIHLAERLRAAPAYEEAAAPGDVVAADAGVVAAVSVWRGQAVVRPGERVQPGQVLIVGMSPSPGGEVPVHASGVVLVRRWYAARAEVPRTVQVEVPTGRVFTRLALVMGSRAIYLAGWRRVPFAHYLLERRVVGPFHWRSFPLPIEAVTLRYLEVSRFVRHLTLADAEAVAAARARAALLPRLPRRARIVQELQRTRAEPGQRVVVELLLESEENIGVFRTTLHPKPAGPAPGSG